MKVQTAGAERKQLVWERSKLLSQTATNTDLDKECSAAAWICPTFPQPIRAVRTFKDTASLTKAAAQWHPEGTDIVVDATGNDEMIRFGASHARFGGTLVLAGYCEDRIVEVRPDTIHLKNLRVLGGGNVWGFMGNAARCAADGIVRTEQMITHRYKLEDYETAFSRETVSKVGYIKGVFLFE